MSKSETPDVAAIMERIREEVKVELAASGRTLPKYIPPEAKLFDGSASPVLYSDELNYLNAHWNDWAEAPDFSSHRPIVGGFIVRLKRAVRRFISDSLFKEYFDREREFNMQLVRYLNAAARYTDARDSEIFWQIVKKADSDIAAINQRADRLFDESLRGSSSRLERLESVLLSENGNASVEGKVKRSQG